MARHESHNCGTSAALSPTLVCGTRRVGTTSCLKAWIVCALLALFRWIDWPHVRHGAPALSGRLSSAAASTCAAEGNERLK